MLLHQKIRKWREKKDLKQWDVAEKLGISQPAYSDIECGKTDPSVEQKEMLSEIFDVPIEQFYTDGEHSEEAYLALQKDYEHEKQMNVELRKENAYLEKIVELLGGKKK